MIEEHAKLAERFNQLKSLQLKDNKTPIFLDTDNKDIRVLLESCFNYLINQASQNLKLAAADTIVPQH